MLINKKYSIFQKMAFEVRYRYGFTYLDKCGKTLNAIMRSHPEWVVKGDDPTPHSGKLISINNGCSLSFSAHSYNLILEMPTGGDPLSDKDVDIFVYQAEMLSQILNDYLGLEEFTRIGLRAWYLFRCQSKKEAQKWMDDLGIYSTSQKTLEAFGGSIDAASVVFVIDSQDRKYRLSVSVVEQQAQVDLGEEILSVRASTLSKDQNKFLLKQDQVRRRVRSNPEFAGLIDIDAFQDNPISIDPRDYIETSIKHFNEKLSAATQN